MAKLGGGEVYWGGAWGAGGGVGGMTGVALKADVTHPLRRRRVMEDPRLHSRAIRIRRDLDEDHGGELF